MLLLNSFEVYLTKVWGLGGSKLCFSRRINCNVWVLFGKPGLDGSKASVGFSWYLTFHWFAKVSFCRSSLTSSRELTTKKEKKLKSPTPTVVYLLFCFNFCCCLLLSTTIIVFLSLTHRGGKWILGIANNVTSHWVSAATTAAWTFDFCLFCYCFYTQPLIPTIMTSPPYSPPLRICCRLQPWWRHCSPDWRCTLDVVEEY